MLIKIPLYLAICLLLILSGCSEPEKSEIENVIVVHEPEKTTADNAITEDTVKYGDEWSVESETVPVESTLILHDEEIEAVVNISSKKYHISKECRYVKTMAEENRQYITAKSLSAIESLGYTACKVCTASAQISDIVTEVITSGDSEDKLTVVINTKSGTLHVNPQCRHVAKANIDNLNTIKCDDIYALIAQGYKPCGTCSKDYK